MGQKRRYAFSDGEESDCGREKGISSEIYSGKSEYSQKIGWSDRKATELRQETWAYSS